MKKLYKLAALFISALCLSVANVNAQTTVYTNAFPGSGGVGPIPGGVPLATFTSTSGSSDATPGSGAAVQIGGVVGSMTLTDNQLASWTSVATVMGTTNNGFAFTSAPLAGYSAPFNPTLTLNTELITWTFNMRTSVPATGFAAGQDNAAVVLVADNPNVRSAGSGYAVTYNPALPQGFQLIRYSGGGLLGGITVLVSSSPALSSPTNYASLKVIYEPVTDQWTLYVRDDGVTGFADPSTGVTVAEGSMVDATLTSSPMTSFSFYGNYSVTYIAAGPDAQNAYFDNFSVTMSCPEIEGGLTTCVGLTTALSNPIPGGVWSSVTPSVATIDAGTGIVTGVAPGTSDITYVVGTCTVMATVTVSPFSLVPPILGVLEVCQGQTTPLTLASPATGTWSSGNPAVGTVNAVTGVVTGISGGTAVISFTVPTGCFSTAIVTVDPITPIMGLPVFCEGDIAPLSDAVAGGTWSSTDPSVADIDITTGMVTAIGGGTAIITYMLPTTCFAVVTVTVNITPTPITGSPTVCEGGTTLLSSGPAGGFWSSSNETVASVTSGGLLIGSSAGTSLITYKLITGCMVTLEITVNPTPSGIGGTLDVCEGATTALTNTLAGGTWSSSDVTVGTIDITTGVLTGILAGTTEVTYMMPTGCLRTAVVSVNPSPAPITGVQSVCVGLTTTLSSSPGGAWTSGDVTIATVLATGVVTGVSANTVLISYSFPTGCRRVAVVTVTPLPPAIGGTATVCTGRTTALTNTSVGGTWGSSDLTIATVGSSSGIVTGVAIGTATIIYTIGTGCTTSMVVTVIASPSAITGTASVCVGATTTLSSTTIGGNWTSSNTGIASVDIATGIVTGVLAGTARISYTMPNGCFSTIITTVNPIPNAITGTATVCENAQTVLSSTSGGGTWSSSDITIAVVIGVSGTGTVTGTASGTADITYTRLGCITTKTVTVNSIPALIGGPNSVCIGSSITLTNTTPGGTWLSSNTGVATIGSSSGIITTVAVGTTTTTYRLTLTGCFRTRTTTVNPLPGAIGGPTTLCPASNVTLTCTPPGGTWSSGDVTKATIVAGTGVLTGVATGTAPITYTSAAGCIRSVVVTISAAPPAVITPIGDTILCPGDFVTLTSSTSPGVTYEWYIGGTLIPTATAPTYVASSSGSYRVKVVVAAGCSTLSVPMAVSVVPATATITLPGGSATTCSGTAATMNANTGVGLTYQWMLGGSPIAGATASTYGALIGGSYTVRVTNSAGCWAISSPTMITVNPAPSNVVAISGPLTICAGNSVTFTAASGTGYSYQWYNTAGAIAGATSIAYAATLAETYHVVITDGSGCTTTTSNLVVIVNPVPNVAITPGGPRIFCTGGSVALDAAPGFNYQWYRGGSPVAGATNATYTASIAGGYRVKVTDATTGCWAMTGADTVVTTVGIPVIIPLTPAKFCWGGSSLLSTNASYLGSAITYQWFFNGVIIPGAISGTYNATVAGDYSCRVIVPASCSAMTSNITVTQMPLPDPPITFDGIYFRTGNYYVTYQWYKNLIPITGATAFITSATSNGNYKVAVTDTNGCQAVSAVYVLTGWTPPPPPNSVANVNSTDIKIFPNPTSEKIFIEASMNVRAVISGVDGKTLIDKENAKEISLKGLADGLYMITLFDDNGQQLKVQKIVKQ